MIRLQLQFFFRIPGGINYCNVTLHFYMILSYWNIICNNFVPNGIAIWNRCDCDFAIRASISIV